MGKKLFIKHISFLSQKYHKRIYQAEVFTIGAIDLFDNKSIYLHYKTRSGHKCLDSRLRVYTLLSDSTSIMGEMINEEHTTAC